MTAKHSPGPWTVEDASELNIFSGEQDGSEWHVATLNEWNDEYHPGHGCDRANARLIASAPDLLTAMKEIENAVPHATNARDLASFAAMLQNIASSAIAKAEGGAS